MKPFFELTYEMLRWEPYKGKPGWTVMKVSREIEDWLVQTGVCGVLRMDLNIALSPYVEFDTEADALLFKLRWL